MRLLHLSDTHSLHRSLQNLPAADIIIHSGDVSKTGKAEEVMDFIKWFGGLDYKYRIFIAGNHDTCLDSKDAAKIQKLLPENCIYLYASGIEIEGIRFWGIPAFISYLLNVEKYMEDLEAIPRDTDILITHNPPYGILDRYGNTRYGCPFLQQKVLEIKPEYHLFGHIHDAYGSKRHGGTTFINGAILDEQYCIANSPVEINL
ncbi:MAG: metallophosphatase domain-containing protein [Dysgonamonadaceae bacterium]|jgi:Icc-related predicted phosphoesterase|nr:metallophosphatase domain-containing protein [Dysgonamonadaceae bacterium]